MNRIFSCCILVGLFSLTSCIKDELPNIEADITEVTYSDGDGVLNVAFHNTDIDVYVDPGTATPNNMQLGFVLSQGATILPNPENINDYSQPRIFTVTSEDGQWSREYRVRVVDAELPTHYDFEHWYQPVKQKYMIPYEDFRNTDEKMFIWACGNDAFSFLVGSKDDYTAFPTQPSHEAKVGSTCAKLVTMLTGQIDKPIAAGNLFIGEFDSKLRDPLESTQFGLPFSKKPIRITGWYKYHSGGLTYKTHSEDQCRIQAVLFKTDANFTHLNGYTIKGDPHIVARAEIPEGKGNSTDGQWVFFSYNFEYASDVTEDEIKNGSYSLAVIFSASQHGDQYDGAPGSVMYVDDVHVICQGD